MFEECTTLAELNAARIKAVSAGQDITEVNNAYNSARYAILMKRAPYTLIQFKTVPNPSIVRYSTLKIQGMSPKLGVISADSEGFYV